jgi:hypothetical protein
MPFCETLRDLDAIAEAAAEDERRNQARANWLMWEGLPESGEFAIEIVQKRGA